MRRLAIALSLIACTGAAHAESDDDEGTLNPEELTLRAFVDRARSGKACLLYTSDAADE